MTFKLILSFSFGTLVREQQLPVKASDSHISLGNGALQVLRLVLETLDLSCQQLEQLCRLLESQDTASSCSGGRSSSRSAGGTWKEHQQAPPDSC